MNSYKYERIYDRVISNYTYGEILEIYGMDRVLAFIESDAFYKTLIHNIMVKDMVENSEPEQYIETKVDTFLSDYLDTIGKDAFLDVLDQKRVSDNLVKELLPNLIFQGTFND